MSLPPDSEFANEAADRLLGRHSVPQAGKMDKVMKNFGNGLAVSAVDEW